MTGWLETVVKPKATWMVSPAGALRARTADDAPRDRPVPFRVVTRRVDVRAAAVRRRGFFRVGVIVSLRTFTPGPGGPGLLSPGPGGPGLLSPGPRGPGLLSPGPRGPGLPSPRPRGPGLLVSATVAGCAG